MNTEFHLFPERASTVAGQVDALYLFLTAVAVFFTLSICVVILFFGIRYRRSAGRGRQGATDHHWLEAAWIVMPLFLTMIMFGWGAVIYFDMQSPPRNAIPIDVIGKQWMWKVQHTTGRREINQLHVPVNIPVRLRMISDDVIHSFFVPAFRVKQDVVPGRYTELWFEATRIGTYHLFCAEYCGTEHSRMIGQVTVLPRDHYSQWLSETRDEAQDIVGRRLFERFRCGDCHHSDGTGAGPDLRGVFGRSVTLSDGKRVTADERYLRDAILNPQKHVLAGSQPVMPLYQGQLTETDVLQLIAFLKSLSSDQPQPRP